MLSMFSKTTTWKVNTIGEWGLWLLEAKCSSSNKEQEIMHEDYYKKTNFPAPSLISYSHFSSCFTSKSRGIKVIMCSQNIKDN